MSIRTKDLFDLSMTLAGPLLESEEYPWLVLPKIRDFILEIGPKLPNEIYKCTSENVWIAQSAKIHKNAELCGPAIIGPNTELRTGAYIRGNVIIGEGCVIGNSCEIKNSIIFNNAQVPHFNYIGDSILGYKAHTGAGAITSNVKSDKSLVKVRFEGNVIETGLKKFGAIIGDGVEVGCNSVLNPGTVIGRNSNIYPLSMVRGYVPPNCIYKSKNDIVLKNNN
ncbi:MAG: UDP-N-acetylglucosamine pyrophosphorylase [Clostridia bacterium]|nr:UDP-N-acetylglucosamine pyrophosphorylase [Clostridia bacterium]